MNNAIMLIERLRRKLPKPTDYAVAKTLEMSQGQLRRVLDGKHGLGPKAVIRLHELLNMDTTDILVLVEEDKAKTPNDKDFWGRRSPRITASAAIAAMALGLAVIYSKDARATNWMDNQPNVTDLYIMRSMLVDHI